MKQVVIIDYGSGNLHSIAKAVEKAAEGKSFAVKVSNSVDEVKAASHIILPGVGAFGDCVAGVEAISGMRAALEEAVIRQKKPFLGVCVGMQMLADIGLENGSHKGLGWISGQVEPISAGDLKIPHMGWNELSITKDHPILNGIKNGDHVYFVHSYRFNCKNSENILSTVEYGDIIPAVIANENIVATQFHPEKSQNVGLRLIGNFLANSHSQ